MFKRLQISGTRLPQLMNTGGFHQNVGEGNKSFNVSPSLVPRPSYHGVPIRGPGNNSLRMRLIKTARYA